MEKIKKKYEKGKNAIANINNDPVKKSFSCISLLVAILINPIGKNTKIKRPYQWKRNPIFSIREKLKYEASSLASTSQRPIKFTPNVAMNTVKETARAIFCILTERLRRLEIWKKRRRITQSVPTT